MALKIKNSVIQNNLPFLNLTKEIGKSYYIKSIEKQVDTDGTVKTTKFNTELYKVDLIEFSGNDVKTEKYVTFLPTALKTRINNLFKNKNITQIGNSDILHIRYLGKKNSNRSRVMHSFFVEYLSNVIDVIEEQ